MKVHEVVSEEVITEREDHQSQYLEDKDVDITAIKEPFHQQLKKELLCNLKKMNKQGKVNKKEKCSRWRKNCIHEH